ncbi:tectonin beta-propeller repeat-containing protein 2 isoform X2 [Callorhinchus milii]|uniref:tectonin beta-propeller repeat-containing protein 2 isoform X2 n=1 Tax=Callorhinchus milii TaxID=7868 RepID=UPI001C3F75A3|nr:tectonin beta-propeller repeat-containing protein 2 isoform X2 [Callorhinchus milii]
MASDVCFTTFKEFSPLYYLLNAIPKKIQKGFRSILVHLTALDANKDYIAVGTSIGMLYLYCRRLKKMKKYNLEGKTETITVVKLLACFDDLVAIGTASGRVALFQLVSPLPGRNKQLRRFDIVGVHKNTITTLTWSTNGMKLFSGDDQGKVAYINVDLDQGACNSTVILEDSTPIVQLDYNQKVLLVSTYHRSLLIYTEQNIINQVGTQPRKSAGRFGACFLPGLCKQSALTLYSSRPGLRLWKSDIQGTVQSTLILKDVFANGVKPFELFPRLSSPTGSNVIIKPTNRNLGILKSFLHDGWLLSWNEESIYVVDSVNQALIGGLEGSSAIVSVSCTEDEIFVLTGDRDIIRISNRPEGVNSQLSPLYTSMKTTLASAESLHAIQQTEISVQEMQHENSASIFDASKLQRSLSAPSPDPDQFQILSTRYDLESEMGDETGERCCSLTSEPRSRSSSVNSNVSTFSHITTPEQHVEGFPSATSTKTPGSSERFRSISMEEFDQQLIVISLKKKKKRKQANSTSESSVVKSEMNCFNESQSSEATYLSDFVIDGSLTTTCDFSDQISLSSSLDRLTTDSPDQESQVSADLNNILQEENNYNISDIVVGPESFPTLLEEPLFLEDFSLKSSVNASLTNEGSSCSNMNFANFSGFESSNKSEILGSYSDKIEDRRDEDPLLHNVPDGEVAEANEKSYGSTSCLQDSLDNNVVNTTTNCHSPRVKPDDPGHLMLFVCDRDNVQETLSESSECYLDERHTLLMRILSPDKIPNNQSKAFSQLHIDDDEHHSLVVTKTEDDTETFVYNADEETEKKHTQAQLSSSSDDEDIYGHGQPQSSSETSVTELHRSYCAEESLGTVFPDMAKPGQEELEHLKSDQQFSESWMGYSGPGCGILSLVVSEKHIWCLDYKGVLYCSPVHSGSLRWQKFEDYVQQVSVSPSGILLWKIDQKSSKAFACGKVTMKGKRHWYEALPQAVYVALSDDTAWIIQTNGELYLQTGLSADRPCARAVKVDCSYPLVQITSRDNVVWALTEQRTVLFRHGISSLCPEGEQWLCDIVSERQMLEPVCIALGDQQTSWALDTNGNLWFRSGVTPNKPQGEDDHWWQVSITDYVVFDQCSIFQTIIHATQTVASVAQAPVERVADKLRGAFWSQQPPSHPSLLNVNSSGVWITSGKNEFHVAKGNLIGTYWKTVVPRGTVSAAKWAFVMASVAPTKKGSFLWLGQSNKDLFCINDQNSEFRPSTVQLPPDLEMVLISACPDAIWGLDSKGQIHIRTLSESCPSGMHWTKLDVTQLGNVKLASLTCGSQHVWACDVDGIVYFRVGTQPLNPSMMLPAWIAIEPPEQPLRTQLISIYSSPNDQMLWAIDNRGNVHVRIGITEAMPVGTDWEHVPGLQASQLAVSTRTVWVCCSNGNVARRYGITEKNPTGDYWKKIPGNVTCLTVTPQDELWAISPGGSLLQRLTKAFSHSNTLAKSSRSSLLCQSEDFDDEWEVI